MVFGLSGTGVRLGAERVFAFGGMRSSAPPSGEAAAAPTRSGQHGAGRDLGGARRVQARCHGPAPPAARGGAGLEDRRQEDGALRSEAAEHHEDRLLSDGYSWSRAPIERAPSTTSRCMN